MNLQNEMIYPPKRNGGKEIEHERIEKIHKRDLVCKPPGTSCMSSVTRTTELTRVALREREQR